MTNFERKPKRDPVAAMEELKHGRFSMFDEKEKDKKKKEAIAAGKDPEEALREYQEKLNRATGSLRKKQREKAIRELEDKLNKGLDGGAKAEDK